MHSFHQKSNFMNVHLYVHNIKLVTICMPAILNIALEKMITTQTLSSCMQKHRADLSKPEKKQPGQTNNFSDRCIARRQASFSREGEASSISIFRKLKPNQA